MHESLAIPDDLAACQALLVEQARAITEQSDKITEQSQTILSLQQQVQEQQLTINELLQRAFRHRSERYLEDPNQLKLDFGNTPEAADAAAGLAEAVEEAELLVAEHQRRRRVPKKPRSEQLPEHLPRYEVQAEVPDDVKHCATHGERKLIGYDRTETLEFERPKLNRLRLRSPPTTSGSTTSARSTPAITEEASRRGAITRTWRASVLQPVGVWLFASAALSLKRGCDGSWRRPRSGWPKRQTAISCWWERGRKRRSCADCVTIWGLLIACTSPAGDLTCRRSLPQVS